MGSIHTRCSPASSGQDAVPHVWRLAQAISDTQGGCRAWPARMPLQSLTPAVNQHVSSPAMRSNIELMISPMTCVRRNLGCRPSRFKQVVKVLGVTHALVQSTGGGSHTTREPLVSITRYASEVSVGRQCMASRACTPGENGSTPLVTHTHTHSSTDTDTHHSDQMELQPHCKQPWQSQWNC
jgi:hypothetical protein